MRFGVRGLHKIVSGFRVQESTRGLNPKPTTLNPKQENHKTLWCPCPVKSSHRACCFCEVGTSSLMVSAARMHQSRVDFGLGLGVTSHELTLSAERTEDIKLG